MSPVPQPPRCLRPFRWPLTVLVSATLALFAALALLGDPALLDAHGGWVCSVAVILGILCISAWLAPPSGSGSRPSRM